jgi:hypothetical protein
MEEQGAGGESVAVATYEAGAHQPSCPRYDESFSPTGVAS